MKLVHWELQQLLDEYARVGDRSYPYEVSGVKYWSGATLAAAMNIAEPLGVRFFIGGFAIATPCYWPDMRKISVRHLLETNAKIAGANPHHYRSMINELYNSTRRI